MNVISQTADTVTVQLNTRELLLIRVALAMATGYVPVPESPDISETRADRMQTVLDRMQGIDITGMVRGSL